MATYGEHDEWLEPDGLGGFASGTASGIRTRRYHALLLSATTPPTGRMVLVNGFDAWIETAGGTFALTSQRYEPGVVHPDGATRVTTFSTDPWPRWVFTFEDGTMIEHDLVVLNGAPVVALTWRVSSPPASCDLFVRPFFSGRDYHALHRENGAFRFEPEYTRGGLVWRPYDGTPAVHVLSNAEYRHQPDWYRNFQYEEERARGLDCIEDLASPGVFQWSLDRGEGVLIFGTAAPDGTVFGKAASIDWPAAGEYVEELRASETARRTQFRSPLHRAADAYLVARGSGKTIVAGYPWFTDWGRDTFIALRGICLAADRIDDARRILIEWSGAISDGMLPNRFPDHGESPEFNSVDASLWFVIAVYDLFDAAERCGVDLSPRDRRVLEDAVDAILSAYAAGTRYGIRLDEDGLLAAGVPGVQLTWMDAKIGDWVVTPRIGKPVEVEALWLNALWLTGRRSPIWRDVFARGQAAFQSRFWNEATGGLNDVVDVDHRLGTMDASFRPNQIFALGGLPVVLVDARRSRRAIDAIESRLWTPLGLRSLAENEPGYTGHYGGGPLSRDGAYHQGTVWPWLLTSFVDAWVRIRGSGVAVKRQARERFFAPLLTHLDEAGLGHVAEIADGDPPHTPNGCPFQAWSVGEALRLDRNVLAPARKSGRNRGDESASKSVNGDADEMAVR